MNTNFWDVITFIGLMFFCSCAAQKTNIMQKRNYSTGIEEGERVVVVLNTFHAYDKSIESEGEEEALGNCMSKGMMKTNRSLRMVAAKDFRRTVFANKKFEDSPRSSKVLLSFLSGPSTQSQVTELGLRYIIIVSVTTRESEARSHAEAGGSGGSGICVFGREWTKYYSMSADVLDVKYLRESGSIRASSSGTAGCGFFTGVLGGSGYCLPVPPVPFYFSQRTEAEGCSSLGAAVMDFIKGGDESVPALPPDDLGWVPYRPQKAP